MGTLDICMHLTISHRELSPTHPPHCWVQMAGAIGVMRQRYCRESVPPGPAPPPTSNPVTTSQGYHWSASPFSVPPYPPCAPTVMSTRKTGSFWGL